MLKHESANVLNYIVSKQIRSKRVLEEGNTKKGEKRKKEGNSRQFVDIYHPLQNLVR